MRIALATLTAIAAFPTGMAPVASGLDGSWTYAVNQIGAHGFGAPVAFTYGPLGFLLYPNPIGHNIFWASLFRCAVQAALVLVVLVAARDRPLPQLIAFLALYLLATGLKLTLDFNLLALSAAGGALVVRYRSMLGLLALGLFASGLLFVKANLGAGGLSIVALTAAILAHRRRSVIAPLLAACAICCSTGLLGLLLFGSFASLAGWLHMTAQISAEYSVAMSFVERSWIAWGAALAVFWTIAAAWLYLTKAHAGPFALVTCGAVFLAFKHGFVREDLHVLSFYSFLLACSVFLILFAATLRECAVGAGLFACVVALELGSGVLPWERLREVASFRRIAALNQALHWSRTDRELRAGADLQADELPPEIVGLLRGTVGVPFELSICAANQLRCSWNPTLQTYLAYTAALDRRTAEHYAGPAAPEFVLLEHTQEFDERLLQLDAPLFWQALVWNYRPVARSPLVLRAIHHELPEMRTFGKMRGSVGQWLEVPAAPRLVFASLDLHLNARGQLARLLWRVPVIWLEAELADGSMTRARVFPANTIGGVLVSEVARNQLELERFFDAEPLPRVRRFRIAGPGAEDLRESFAVSWLSMPKAD